MELFPFQEPSLTDKPNGTFSGCGGDPAFRTLRGFLKKPKLQEAQGHRRHF